MRTPRLTTVRNTIEWPLGRKLKEHPEDHIELLRKLGASAYDEIGKDITGRIMLDDHEVEYYKEGEYPVYLMAMTDQQVQLNHKIYLTLTKQTQNRENIADSNAIDRPKENIKTKGKSNKQSKFLIIALITMIIIILGVFAIHARNKSEAAQANQNSTTSSQISSLQNQNSNLQDQIKQLKNAQSQYQKDKDKKALDDKLNHLQAENNNLRSQLNSNDQKDVDTMNSAINSVRDDPANESAVVGQLEDSDNQSLSYLQQIKENIQNWINGKS